jgi:hypothetical protein
MRDLLVKSQNLTPDIPAAEIARAAVRAVAYGDVFDYALDLETVHRYLHGIRATPEQTAGALLGASRPAGAITRHHGFYTLAGRDGLIELGRRRAAYAARLWPRAITWGRRLARLPFVRMVAVTGALAWSNVEPGDDIDFLIVAKTGRVWITRALVALLSRLARFEGVWLCANYVLSTTALALPERDVYTAYELAHMVPIAGRATYRRMRRLNQWTDAYLPNAAGAPAPRGDGRRALEHGISPTLVRKSVRLIERNLGHALGETLERYEMTRRIRKRMRRAPVDSEARYSREYYRDHLEGHRRSTLDAYAERLASLGLEP